MPSSSLVKIEVEVGVWVEVGVEVEVWVEVWVEVEATFKGGWVVWRS